MRFVKILAATALVIPAAAFAQMTSPSTGAPGTAATPGMPQSTMPQTGTDPSTAPTTTTTDSTTTTTAPSTDPAATTGTSGKKSKKKHHGSSGSTTTPADSTTTTAPAADPNAGATTPSGN